MNNNRETCMASVMVDLETLGVGPRAPIASIGAVKMDFESGTLGDKFYRSIDITGYQNDPNFEIDYTTLKWWLAQGPSVIQSTFLGETVSLIRALADFSEFVSNDRYEIWGNGSDFDNVILAYAYEAAGYKAPWSFSRNRCYRTMKNLGVGAAKPERMGDHHNALDDAVFQAQHLINIMKVIKG